MFLAAANRMFDYAALVAALAAFGVHARPSEVLLAFVVAQALAMVPITPGGLGFVESGLTALLVVIGVPVDVSVIATLLYRLVSFWLPIPIGALAWAGWRIHWAGPRWLETARNHQPASVSAMSIADFPRYPLTFGPSPIHRLERLTEHLGGATVWAKREDCNCGLAYGGNKMRKLEYLVPEAIAQGADTLVSIGGYQSNHTRQVAAVAAHLGMSCVLVQEKWVDWPDSVNDRVGNIMLSRIMGAEVRLDEAGFDIGFRDSWKQAIADVEARGGTPYAIPAGASDHPLGGLGFANWAYEVAQQEERARRLLRHDRGLHGHRVDARRHDRRLRGAGGGRRPAAAGDRHRRLGHAGQDARPGRADRAAYGRADRCRPRPPRRRDHGARGLGRRPLRHPGASPPSTRSG